ncbi:CBASS cGAMP-activated phospholipase [Humidesulfovibrio sp.]
MRKILTIDGGGIKGVFPAAFLATVEEAADIRLADYFDLIVGTSTGGIIALGLGLGFSARELLGLYEKSGRDIFPQRSWCKPWTWRHIGAFWSKYSTTPLKAEVDRLFRDKLLGQSRTRLVIPSTNLTTGEVYVFKTSHHPRIERDPFVAATHVALATAAAPVFFRPYVIPGGQPLVDGGLWANNPTGYAVVEALGVLKWRPEEIRVLSLGCTEEMPTFAKLAGKGPGALRWGIGLLDSFFHAQSSASMGTAKLLLDDRDNAKILRVSPKVAKNLFGLDKVKTVGQLKGLGESEARKALEAVRERFLVERAETFVPCVGLDQRKTD